MKNGYGQSSTCAVRNVTEAFDRERARQGAGGPRGGTSCWGSGDACALVGNVSDRVPLFPARNRARTALSGHSSETCHHLRDQREISEGKESLMEGVAMATQRCASRPGSEGRNEGSWVIQSERRHDSGGMRNWSCRSKEREPTLSIMRGSNVPRDNYLSSFQVNRMHCSASWEVR